eukprot:CAMPEP_0184733040 /NCGR_PEP_ID=MMETSP0314-20130426/56205_1 /TAXON_ID=38298 /ORGANISM="Rhodella maculata, Strain CCMP 736" /LENGTH=49 /DNA_ID=CAMNT_0027199757 /DNA_START=243 /DNA_END=392 /DNA_ORIENTATION=-
MTAERSCGSRKKKASTKKRRCWGRNPLAAARVAVGVAGYYRSSKPPRGG